MKDIFKDLKDPASWSVERLAEELKLKSEARLADELARLKQLTEELNKAMAKVKEEYERKD